MNKLITFCLVVVGVINFLPVAGLLGIESLESAYRVSLTSNDVVILMQHRALLFGLLGGFILYSVFVPSFQTVAMFMGGVSMIGFAVLVHMVGSENQAIANVLYVDYIGILFLALGAVLKYGTKSG